MATCSECHFCGDCNKTGLAIAPETMFGTQPGSNRMEPLRSTTERRYIIQTQQEDRDAYCRCGQHLTKHFLTLSSILSGIDECGWQMSGIPCPAKDCNATYTIEGKPLNARSGQCSSVEENKDSVRVVESC